MIQRFLPFAASEHAARFDAVLTSVHIHMAIQLVAWGGFFIYCLWRFRAKVHPQPAPQTLRPLWPALAIAVVILGDALLLAIAALPAWRDRMSLPNPMSRPQEVRIVAEQFAWNIHYPGPDGRFGATSDTLITSTNPLGIDRRDEAGRDDIGLQNFLAVEVGRPVIVRLSSRDVVHSFTLNEMRVKQDATPGLNVRTWFTPTAIGEWDIACSQLCGLGHYRMRGGISVMSTERWTAWQAREVSLITPLRR
jgi:cytochrome c oxidase subunit 2